MRAFLKNYRQSPRKVRLVADIIRGQSVPRARRALRVLGKRAALQMAKLLDSAVANARHNDSFSDEGKLIIKELRVDEGPTLKRFMPRAHGRATPIHKRTSHIIMILGEETTSAKKKTPILKEKTASKTLAAKKKEAKKEAKK